MRLVSELDIKFLLLSNLQLWSLMRLHDQSCTPIRPRTYHLHFQSQSLIHSMGFTILNYFQEQKRAWNEWF